MQYLLLGCCAFIFFYIFDLNKLFPIHRLINMSFVIGMLLLIAATTGILQSDLDRFALPMPMRMMFGLLATAALALQFYCLFGALPFKKTYLEGENGNTVVDTGFYGLCRHPGVLCFMAFYLFLWLASGIHLMLWAGIIWTIMDVIHVYVQDRWLFPKNLTGYDRYQQTVPFLIPSKTSFNRFIASLRRGRSHESRQEA